MGYETRLMKDSLVRLCLLAALGGVGCAVGSSGDVAEGLGSIPQRDGAAPSADVLPGDGGSSRANDGAVAANDGAASALDAGAKDAGVVVPEAAVDSGPCSFTGPLVSFDLTKLAAGQTDLAASSTAPGVTAASLARVGVAAVSSSGAMNSSDWSLGAVDTGKYYVFSVTPPPGCKMTMTSLAIDLKASNTGPTAAAAGTSADSYGALANFVVTTSGGSVNVPLAGINGTSSAVEVHVFGFNAGSSAGTMRIQKTLSVVGALGPI
jgi:hypothetical protein